MLKAHLSGIARARVDRRRILGTTDLNFREDRDRVVLHSVQHVAEHLEGFTLVLLLWIALRVAAQMNALA